MHTKIERWSGGHKSTTQVQQSRTVLIILEYILWISGQTLKHSSVLVHVEPLHADCGLCEPLHVHCCMSVIQNKFLSYTEGVHSCHRCVHFSTAENNSSSVLPRSDIYWWAKQQHYQGWRIYPATLCTLPALTSIMPTADYWFCPSRLRVVPSIAVPLIFVRVLSNTVQHRYITNILLLQ